MMNRFLLAISTILTFTISSVQAQCPTVAATTITTTNETCPGASDGSITLTFTDATTPFTYFVVNLTTGIASPTITETINSATFADLPAGNYSISVIDVTVPCITTFDNGGSGIVIGSDPFPTLVTGQVKTICSSDNVNYEILLSPLNDPPGTVFNWPVPTMSDGSTQGTAGVNVAADPAGTLHITDVLINNTGSPITATYQVTPFFGTCAGATEDIVITVDPAPLIQPGQTKLICGGEAVDYEILLQPLNMPAGTTFDWGLPVMSDGSVQGSAGVNVAADPAGTLHITDVLNNTSSNDITATYTITPSNTCPGVPETVVITVAPTPVVLPGQVKTICSGDPVALEILLAPLNTPSGSTFDWGVPVMSDGSTQGTAGTNVAADPAGTIHINDVLVNTTGAAITATYSIIPTRGSCVGVTEDIVITVSPEPVIVPGQVGTVCSGSPVNHEILLSPANAPPGVTFDWPVPVMSDGSTQGTAGIAVAADPAGTIHIIDALVNTSGVAITATYTVTPTFGVCTGQSETLVFTINPEPVIQTGQVKTICSSEDVNLEILLTPLNSPPGTVFDWGLPVMSDGSTQGTAGIAVAADPAGTLHITDNLINFTGVPITATYSVTPTSSFGCVGATEDIVITIAPEPVVAPGQTKTICSGQSADFEILLTPLNMPAGTLLDWPVPVMSDGSAQGSAGSSIAADPAGTLHITDVFMNTTGVPITATYDITPSNGACLGATETVVITIDPGPVVLPGQTTTICSGDPVNMEILLTPANLPAGTTLDWAAPTMSDGSIQGSAGVGVSADPAGTIHITDILINQTGAPITAVYTVTPTNGLCVGGAESIVVTIEPEPVIQPGQVKSICNGDAVNVEILLNPLNTPAGSTFDWPAPTMSAGPPQGTAGVNVAADPAGTLHITDILNNVTSSPITATYSVTATSGSCSGATVDIVITIVPDPTDVGIVEAPAQDICEGVDQTITLATSDNGVDYEILVDGVSSGLPVVTGDGSNNLLIGTLSGLAVGSYTISVTATVGSCMITLSDNVALNVNAVPSSAITGPLVVCENTTETYSAPAGATSYVWTLTGGDGVISSGAGTETIAVDWLTTGGDLAVTVTGPAPTDCSSTTTVIVGVFGVLPQLPDENLDVCQNTAIPTLTTTPIAGATVNWYLIAVDPTNLIGTGASFTPSSTDLDMSVVGTTNFLFTQDIGCGESPAANYAVNVLAAPNAGSSNTVNMCITSAATDLFLALGGTPDAGGIWTDDDSSGALTGSIFDPAVAGDGVFNFTYRVDGAGVCSGEFATAVITAGVASGSNMPTPEQSSYTACTFGSSPTLTVIGANVLWYSDVALTSQIGSGASFIPTDGVDIDMTIQGITSYYATQDEGCGESAGVQVDVLLEGVTADIGTIMNTYPEQDIGSIEVINIDSNNPPFDIQLLDDNGNVIENRTAVGQDFLGNYSFFYDQLSAGTYEVVLEDAAGCQLSITPVVIAFNTDVFIPNVFTPNGDSYNDTFKILNMQPNTKIEISNRWGVRVFSADDYQNDWQAVGLADGVYYYTVDMNGAIFKGNVEVWRGN